MAVGDLEHAVCLTTLDAPFVELGTPSGEDYRLNPRHGYGWWPSAQISPVVYSWVMNNTWRTNYKASQGGVASFRYSLQICDPFDLKLKQRGAEREQPLIAVESGRAEPVGRLFPARRPPTGSPCRASRPRRTGRAISCVCRTWAIKACIPHSSGAG